MLDQLKKYFRGEDEPPKEVILTEKNIDYFPSFKEMLDERLIIPDSKGRLRYLHGAPVGKLLLVKINKDGTPKYKEMANEWFDPESPKAKSFIWP